MEHVAPRDTTIAVDDDKLVAGLQKPEAGELGDGIGDFGLGHTDGETLLRDRCHVTDRGIAVTAVKHDGRQRLQAVRAPRLGVVDDGLIADPLDQKTV